VDNELEVIRHQMEEKRASLADKLDALENQVIDQVHDTTKEVTNIVHEVKEGISDVVQEVKSTVGTVVEDVKSTAESVTDGVKETVESVKDTFDFREHIRRHPWLSLGGAFAAGFAGAYLFAPSSRTSRTGSWQPHPAAPESLSDLSAPRREETPSRPEPAPKQGGSTTDHLLSVLGETGTQALTKVKELAVGTLMGLLGEVIANSLPANLKSEASNLMNDLTTKLGGKIIDFSKNQPTEGERNDNGHQAEVGGAVGSVQRSDQEPVGQCDRRRIDPGPGGLRTNDWYAQGTHR